MAQEAFAVIREAMRKENLVGLARVVIYRREHLLLLAPRGKGIMATALRYNTEVRSEKDYFDEIPDIKVPADMLKLAVHILDSKKGKFNPDKFEDRYENALEQADRGQARRQEAADARRTQAEQRHQPDGRAAAQRQGRRPQHRGAGAQEPARRRKRPARAQEGQRRLAKWPG